MSSSNELTSYIAGFNGVLPSSVMHAVKDIGLAVPLHVLLQLLDQPLMLSDHERYKIEEDNKHAVKKHDVYEGEFGREAVHCIKKDVLHPMGLSSLDVLTQTIDRSTCIILCDNRYNTTAVITNELWLRPIDKLSVVLHLLFNQEFSKRLHSPDACHSRAVLGLTHVTLPPQLHTYLNYFTYPLDHWSSSFHVISSDQGLCTMSQLFVDRKRMMIKESLSKFDYKASFSSKMVMIVVIGIICQQWITKSQSNDSFGLLITSIVSACCSVNHSHPLVTLLDHAFKQHNDLFDSKTLVLMDEFQRFQTQLSLQLHQGNMASSHIINQADVESFYFLASQIPLVGDAVTESSSLYRYTPVRETIKLDYNNAMFRYLQCRNMFNHAMANRVCQNIKPSVISQPCNKPKCITDTLLIVGPPAWFITESITSTLNELVPSTHEEFFVGITSRHNESILHMKSDLLDLYQCYAFAIMYRSHTSPVNNSVATKLTTIPCEDYEFGQLIGYLLHATVTVPYELEDGIENVSSRSSVHAVWRLMMLMHILFGDPTLSYNAITLQHAIRTCNILEACAKNAKIQVSRGALIMLLMPLQPIFICAVRDPLTITTAAVASATVKDSDNRLLKTSWHIVGIAEMYNRADLKPIAMLAKIATRQDNPKEIVAIYNNKTVKHVQSTILATDTYTSTADDIMCLESEKVWDLFTLVSGSSSIVTPMVNMFSIKLDVTLNQFSKAFAVHDAATDVQWIDNGSFTANSTSSEVKRLDRVSMSKCVHFSKLDSMASMVYRVAGLGNQRPSVGLIDRIATRSNSPVVATSKSTGYKISLHQNLLLPRYIDKGDYITPLTRYLYSTLRDANNSDALTTTAIPQQNLDHVEFKMKRMLDQAEAKAVNAMNEHNRTRIHSLHINTDHDQQHPQYARAPRSDRRPHPYPITNGHRRNNTVSSARPSDPRLRVHNSHQRDGSFDYVIPRGDGDNSPIYCPGAQFSPDVNATSPTRDDNQGNYSPGANDTYSPTSPMYSPNRDENPTAQVDEVNDTDNMGCYQPTDHNFSPTSPSYHVTENNYSPSSPVHEQPPQDNNDDSDIVSYLDPQKCLNQ